MSVSEIKDISFIKHLRKQCCLHLIININLKNTLYVISVHISLF